MNIFKRINRKLKELFVTIEKDGNVYLSNYLGKKWYINYPQKSMCLWALEFMNTHERFIEIVRGGGDSDRSGGMHGRIYIECC